MQFVQEIIDGVEIASIYALLSLALTLGANIDGIINFVSGQLFIIGIYIISFFCDLSLPVIISVLIAIFICAGINLLIKRYVYDLIGNKEYKMKLIVSLGLSFLIEDIFVFLFKANPRKLFYNAGVKGNYILGKFEVSHTDILCLSIFLFVMLISYIFIKHTRFGKIIRAVSENSESTALMGIDNNKIVCYIYGICAGLIVIAGSFFYISYPLVDPFSGNMIILRSLAGAIIGGLGIVSGSLSESVVKALLGGFFVGLIEILVKSYISVEISDVILFLILAVYLFINSEKYLRRGKM